MVASRRSPSGSEPLTTTNPVACSGSVMTGTMRTVAPTATRADDGYVAVGFAGGWNIARGVTGSLGSLGSPVPISLTALTRNTYSVPLTRSTRLRVVPVSGSPTTAQVSPPSVETSTT